MRKQVVLNAIWWAYLVLLFVIVIVKFHGSASELLDRAASVPFGTNHNLMLFGSIGEQLGHFSQGWAKFNLFGNIVPFAPFGFLLPLVFEKADSYAKVFLVGLGFILFAEAFQFLTRLGSFDVDDILLNMLGISLGYFLFWIRGIRKGKRGNKAS